MRHRLRNQQTLSKTVQIKGFGFWSGRDVNVQFRPASENTGIVFVRQDVDPVVKIPALSCHRVEAPRRTTLSQNGQSVEMVEHIMAALAALHIDNCEIWVDAPEMPGVDGSSLPFVEALLSAGIEVQDEARSFLVVTEITRVGNDECWIEARPGTPGQMSVHYRLDFGNDNVIGRESYRSKVDAEIFIEQLAPARTFILQHEAEWLRNQGLAQRVTPKDVLVFGSDGPIDNQLRFPDECVRHKVLDLVGDLSLAGIDLIGHFVAHRSGHRLNATLVNALLAEHQVQDGLQRSA